MAVVLALVLWFVLSGGVENYRAKYEGYDLSQQIGDIGRSSTYSLYLRAHEGAPDASSDVSIPLVTVDSDGVTSQEDGLLMQSGSSATFAVTVPETGFYNIRLTYRTEAARGVDLERELRINELLTAYLKEVNIELIDFKLEFGITNDGQLVLADEISPDTCRFWDTRTGEKLDKDRFRRDLGNVEDAYIEIRKRLMGE